MKIPSILGYLRNAPRRAAAALWQMPVPLRFHEMGVRPRFTLLFYLVTFLAAAVVGWYGYTSASQAYREKAVDLVAGYTNETANKINNLFDLIRSDLNFITRQEAILRHGYWIDMNYKDRAEYWHEVVTDTLLAFARAYDYNSKLRLINLDGQEHIVVVRDRASGKVESVPDRLMVNRGNLEYFKDGMALKAGDTYASAIDFGREGMAIAKPYVPVVRFIRPLVGDNNIRYGLMVSNIFADSFFAYVRDANKNGQGRRFYFIDPDGNYLFHPDADKAFGHLLGHKASFRDDFPGMVEKLKMKAQGSLLEQGHVIAWQRIVPNPGQNDRFWLLVGVVEEKTALAELQNFKLVFFAILSAVFLLVMAATRYFVGGLMRPLDFVTRQLRRLGRGEVVRETLAYPAQDEIRQMLDSTERLVDGMERLASQADTIAQGDFSGSVPLLSEEDRLGLAINNMTRMLRENRDRNERSNWLKDGLSQLNQILGGDPSPQQMADIAIGAVSRALGAGRGVCYVYDAEQEMLELMGTYMYTERGTLGNRYRLGEGAVGQAAREKKPIILHGVASDYPPITTGTSSASPLHTYTYPLLREGHLYGVMEVASFERFDDLRTEFLTSSAEIIASFLFAALQKDQIHKLLAIAEESARQAREQSAQLQQANALMEEQQQRLQQQTEELQQTNAQMEEQQQQLQQQTEELQQTNAQMEEQQQQLQQQTEELMQTNAQMEEQQQRLEQQAQELRQGSQYKSEFLANMSHELRTPLNSIILLSKMLAMNEEGRLNEDDVKRASVVHRAGEELLRLINDILDLSKIEAGKMELRLQTVHSSDLVDEYRDLFSETATAKDLQFIVDDRWKGDFITDRDKLSQVLRNLLSNAFKFTKQGSVTLRLERGANPALPLRIAVIDTGIGIPEDKQQLVFEAFKQVDGSISREYGGTGLGLSISLRFAQLLGGTIELKSVPGQGSEFAIVLPLALEGRGEASAAIRATLAPRLANRVEQPTTQEQVNDDRANLKTSDKIILVIDDDAPFGEAIAALNKRLGYKTLVALNGAEGLRMAKTYRPKGILLDLGLPDMDGTEVLRELKGGRELRQIPVYIVSGREKIPGLMQQDIVGYLQKPVDETQLAEAEAAVLARAVESAQSILVVEGDALSREKVAAMVRGEPVQVIAVKDVRAALASLKEAPVDLAIVDLTRHDGDGVAVCQALREQHPALPLLLYGKSALSQEQDAALRKFSDSIVIEAPQAERRMLENIERFLKGVATETGAASTLLGPALAAAKKLEGKRILVVDDDTRNLFVITSALEQQGAHVESALNGRKGLDLLKKKPIDLVFMDIMMPEMDGYEAIKIIKADPELRHIPVVALTAKALKVDREKAMVAGANDYLAKPVDYEVLINMAKVWCEEKK